MSEPETVYDGCNIGSIQPAWSRSPSIGRATRNALSEALLAELEAALVTARDDPAVRVVVLASTHETVFSSGADLSGFAADTPPIARYLGTGLFPRIFRLLGALGKPSICAASGHVLAGALGLALACDLIIAKDTARFGTPEINVGLFPFMVMALAYRNVPSKKATELLLLGEQISGTRGRAARVRQPRRPRGRVRRRRGRLGVEACREVAVDASVSARTRSSVQQDMAFADALEYLRAQLGLAFSTADLAEGISAFLEKRDPVWKGR